MADLPRQLRAAVLLCAGATMRSAAQSPPAVSARCENLLVSQQAAAQNRKRPYLLQLAAHNGARLTYFGVRHTYDPADTQFVSLRREFDASKPTIVFYEGTGTRTPEAAD